MDFNKANNFEKEKQSSKKILVIAITLIIILGIAATSIYFYTANAKKKYLKYILMLLIGLVMVIQQWLIKRDWQVIQL